MQTKEWELQSGLKFQLPVPSTVEEFDSLPGGRVGLCLECGVDDVMYRGPFADVRDQLAAALEKKYPNSPRERKAHPNVEKAKKGETVVAESPGKYISRLAALQGWDDASGFQSVLDEIMAASEALPVGHKDKIEFSVEKVARTGAGGLIPKVDLEMADTLLKGDKAALATALDRLGKFLADDNGQPKTIVLQTVDGDEKATFAAQQRQIAVLLKEYRGRLAKQAMAGLTAGA
jgi:hypothetical protein